MENKKNIKCWEHFKCGETACPAFKNENHRCWMIESTHCHKKLQDNMLEKTALCVDCEVFKNNIAQPDFEETLGKISRQFKEYVEKLTAERNELKESQKKLAQFKLTSIYLMKELDKKNVELLSEKDLLEERVRDRTKEIGEMQEKLIRSAKMISMDRFSAGIAHEINNPLGAIINYVRSVLANPEIKSQNRGYLELSLKGLFRIENIVRQILSYASPMSYRLEDADVNKIINESLAFVHPGSSGRKIEIKLNLAAQKGRIRAGSSQLVQVFINLIKNAEDAIEGEGSLIIETKNISRGYEIKLIDSGKGMDEKTLEKIFDPFFSTKEVGRGTGLGLFISYNILQIYRGNIDVKSSPGKGTTVTVFLPWEEDRSKADGK